jgi:DeoR C terminal sensor domain
LVPYDEPESSAEASSIMTVGKVVAKESKVRLEVRDINSAPQVMKVEAYRKLLSDCLPSWAGAQLRHSFSLVGPMAEGTLRRLSADVFFLGVDGFDVEYGLTTPNVLEARIKRTMMDGAKMVVAVCDSGEFGKRQSTKQLRIRSFEALAFHYRDIPIYC